MSAPRLLLGLALSAGLAAAADPAPPRATPAWNWALPLFTNEGFHSMTLRGTEVHPVSSDRIDVVDINITTFSGDAGAQVESSLLSPSASFFLHEYRASGDGPVRLIDYSRNFEVTGEKWVYEYGQKKISIARNVRVIIHAALPDMLK